MAGYSYYLAPMVALSLALAVAVVLGLGAKGRSRALLLGTVAVTEIPCAALTLAHHSARAASGRSRRRQVCGRW
ncbi:MAG: hypothetical protein ACYDEN_01750 [Acidimicrobiales bacterium]